MKKISKILSIILSLIMVISIIPMSTITSNAATYSGTCGDNLTWTYNTSTYTLTISGTGAMKNYSNSDYNNPPWEGYKDNIKTVIINVGVTSIGNYAFYNCDSLTSVTIPDSVTTIGNWAFAYCDSLTSVTIGNSVTTIGRFAFYSCNSLTEVNITDMSAWCNILFDDYDSNPLYCARTFKLNGETVTDLVIPDSVTTIGYYAFYCSNLTSVTVDSNNQYYSSDEYGVLFNQQNGQQANNTAPQKYIIENNPALTQIALYKDNLIKFNVWSKIYKRWVVESYPYSTSRTYEDVRTIPRWCANANKIVIMPETEINYRAADGSIIRTDMVSTRVGTITAIAEQFPRWKDNYNVLKAMYGRAMVDLEALLHNHSSNDAGFNEMSYLNTYMLSFLYPNKYKEMTYHVENDPELKNQKPVELPLESPLVPYDEC